ncbi:Zinc finger HIT domain-containing protein 3 [Coemansia sp. RSA 1813]|nr:Zinc finger HIT domain-containing protein 3 [Coemansia sp. RSA 1646]KAJ1770502.1 Zinc finger HIT domain-containing protein 3 [Coemansia sp. RSA 1843]KAJ2092961.1 Zinc finger HIT domain-containing protein 3 [Coemansia sp. RSA 986]KAJ2216281.1 Zinc finger HIT domain-containing protein 3 [Coemansia sp. RSA 487]KAJ2570546.1 Zinc finger HIT domain-containing protein 3 [Coemansia sp. RSA 1813]
MSAKGGSELCAVCSSVVAKYKCSNCYIRYCSVKCFKDHKTEKSCVAPEKPPNSAAASAVSEAASANRTKSGGSFDPDVNDDDEEAQHRLTAQDLAKLNSSEDVKRLLMYPNIRALVDAVRKDRNPVEAIRMLRQRSDFEELVQALINATSSNK